MHTLKHLTWPGMAGVAICALMSVNLAIAQFLSSVTFFTGVLSPVLSILTLCISVHLIRKTAGLYGRHVWASPSLITLICIPVFNLLITAIAMANGLSVVFDAIASFFTTTVPGMVVTVAFSVPMFLFYYFLYVRRKFTQNKELSIITVILCVAAAVFAVVRLAYQFVTVLGMFSGTGIYDFMSGSGGSLTVRLISLFIYLTAIAGFIIVQTDISKTIAANGEAEEN